MAKGRDRHEARQQAISALGRNLSRRSGSQCELCGAGGPLQVAEVQPVDEQPHEDAAMLACQRCRDLFSAKRLDADDLRFLEASVWADPIPVKVAAITLMKRLAAEEVPWATECMDGLWIDETVQERLDRIR